MARLAMGIAAAYERGQSAYIRDEFGKRKASVEQRELPQLERAPVAPQAERNEWREFEAATRAYEERKAQAALPMAQKFKALADRYAARREPPQPKRVLGRGSEIER